MIQEQEKQKQMFRLLASEFHSEMSHPLSLLEVDRIYLWKHLDCDAPNPDPQVQRSLREIEMAQRQLERLWHNFSDLMEYIWNDLKPMQQPVDLRALLQVLSEECSCIEQTVGTRVKVTLPRSEACIVTDSAMAKQLILGLLVHAMEHSAPGEVIGLTLKSDEEGIRLLLRQKDETLTEPLRYVLCQEIEDGGAGWCSCAIGLHLCRELCRLLEWKPQVKRYGHSTDILLSIPRETTVKNSRLEFRSSASRDDIWREQIRTQLGSVPGLARYWTK